MLLNGAELSAQATNGQIRDVVMPSANASSLGKYGDIPVSYYTGVPSVGIPIHTLSEGSISLPISLSYHAGGVKVGESSSWVGLGWSLQAGGMISRTVQGKPDEAASGYFTHGSKLKAYKSRPTPVCYQQPDLSCRYGDPQISDCIGDTLDATIPSGSMFTNGSVDGEPDIFSFSVGGFNGKFFIDADMTNDGVKNGKVVLIPKQDVDIKYYASAAFGAGSLTRFTLTTPNGVKYDFGSTDDVGGVGNAIELTNVDESNFWQASGWHLKRITSADGANVITLNYIKETYRYGYRTSTGVGAGYNSYPRASSTYYYHDVDMQALRLDYVQTSTEKVTFVAGLDRTAAGSDLASSIYNTTTFEKSKALGQIKIESGTYCKQFTLFQSYFRDNDVPHMSGQYTDNRLRLDSIQESSCSGATTIVPAHVFTYHTKAGNVNYLPNRLSAAIDHWGYYNGAMANPHYGLNIPSQRIKYNFFSTPVDVTIGSSNRETDEESMKLGTIRQIRYPTGGNTTFEYEANTYFDTKGRVDLVPKNSISYRMPEGECMSNTTTPLSVQSLSVNITFADSMYFRAITRKATDWTTGFADPAGGSCSANNVLYAHLYNITTGGLICSGQLGIGSRIKSVTSNSKEYQFDTIQTNLSNLFSCLTSSFPSGLYRIDITGRNVAAQFTILEAQMLDKNTNKKVGGLRIKKVTSSEGTDTLKNVVKAYNYDNTTYFGAARSSGQLYNKPIYSHVYYGYSKECAIDPNISLSQFISHYVMDNSIVPLGSFEGNHIGYTSVREYYNASATGQHNLYLYTNEPAEPFDGIPMRPIQPRIGSGELYTKGQRNANNQDVAYENYYPKSETNDSSALCVKISAYTMPAGPTSTSIFFRFYKIATRPYRLDSVVSFMDNVVSSTTYGYNPTKQHYNPTSVTTTNSDGSTYCTKTYYAHEMNNTALLNRNMVSIPLKTEQYVNNILKSATETQYDGAIPRPKYFKQRNRDGSWQTMFTIDNYNAEGLPTQATRTGFWISETYGWDALKRLTSKSFGTLTTSYAYKPNTRLLDSITDENGFRSQFNYDALMRLEEAKSIFADPAKTLRSTTRYNYVFGGTSNATCNRVGAITTFAGMSDPLSNNQIFDGLGRVIQATKIGYGPNREHIKTAVTYDNLGRQFRSYQPFIANDTACFELIPNGTLSVYPEYEASPLSRPLRQYAEDGKYTSVAYGSNATMEVRKFTINANVNPEAPVAVSTNGYYDANLLYKTTLTNENGTTTPNDNLNKTDVFKDKLGRVVLTRKYLDNTSNGKVDTYNVYDDYGNLVMVIPPGAIVNNAVEGNLVFSYRYNNKNLLCTKKVPGADSVKYYYNNRNLLMLTQDGNMRAESPSKYFGIDYDQLGRKWATGLISTTHPVDDAQYNWYFWTKNLTYDYYIPNTNLLAGTNTASIGAINTALGDRSMMFRSIQYNAKGERDWGCSEYLRYHNCDDYLWNTDGTLKQGNKYNNGANGYQVFYGHKYVYDHSRRLKTAQQQLWGPNGTGGGFYAPWTELSAITYNHKDQVTEKNIGRRTDISGAKALQSIDYSYNARGWLSGINQMPVSYHNAILRTRNGQQVLDIDPNPTYNIASGEGSVDLFSESIRYDAPDANFAAVTPQYNGNISQVMWQVAGRERQAHTYTYDPIDRMTAGVYTDVHDEYIAEIAATIGQPYDPTFERDNKYNETLTYDVRGNITNLSRNGMYTLTQNNGGYLKGTFGQIDSLNYTYNNQNQVTGIVDKAPAANRDKGFKGNNTGASAYTYDANGNLKSDLAKGITNIVYNHMNLPERIEWLSPSNPYKPVIDFVYDATGMKLRKTVTLYNPDMTTFLSRTVTDYMDGFEYVNDKIERIAHAEGYISRREKRSAESSEFVGMGGLVWQYNYVLKDHLGNTRVTFADTTGNGLIDPTIEIAQINHYYPYGFNMDGNWNGASPNVKNKYQYGDKELQTDFGLNWNDYGARNYDAVTARFTTIDPMGEMYLNLSLYQYVENNPIGNIDPTGMMSEAYNFGMQNNNKSPDAIMEEQMQKTNAEKSSNVYIMLHGSADNGGGITQNATSRFQGDWTVVAASNMTEALAVMKLLGFSKGSVDNMVLESHGILQEDAQSNKVWDGFTLRDGSTVNAEKLGDKTDAGTKSMKELLSYVKQGGNFVLAACGSGKGVNGAKLVSELSSLASNCITVTACSSDACGILKRKDITDTKTKITKNGGFIIGTNLNYTSKDGVIKPTWIQQNSKGEIRNFSKLTIKRTGTNLIQFD